MRARGLLGAVASLSAALLAFGPDAARAIPPPEPPRAPPSATLAPVIAGATLPFGSTLFFVLDDRIDSGSSKTGAVARMHLRSALVVNGVTIAPAGAPATLEVVTTRRAQSGDVDGAVQIHLDPIALPGRSAQLPIRAYHEYLTRELTAGQSATRDTTDTIADIFVPYHFLYHALRRGHQLVLPVGSILRAETDATIDASDPKAVVFSTPPPFVSSGDPPHADLTAPPFFTPAPARPKPLPHGKPTLPPTPPPTPVPAVSAATLASPSPAPSTAQPKAP